MARFFCFMTLLVMALQKVGAGRKCEWTLMSSCEIDCGWRPGYECVMGERDYYCCRKKYSHRPSSCWSKGECERKCDKGCYYDETDKGYECFKCSGLSTGAIIGISIAVVVLVIIIIAVVACFCCAMCPGYRYYHHPMVMPPPPVMMDPIVEQPVLMAPPPMMPPPPPPPPPGVAFGMYM